MNLSKIINLLEVKYLELLSTLLKSGEIEVDKAREISKEFLALQPFKNYDDMQAKVNAFLVKNTKFENIRMTLLKNIEEAKTTDVLTKMRVLMKNNKIDEAINLTKIK